MERSEQDGIITAVQLAQVEIDTGYKTVVWHGLNMTIRPLLTMQEVTQFVDSVMTTCHDKERDLFFPEMIDFAFRVNVVMRYACVKLPEDVDEQYRLVYATDLYETIRCKINQSQLNALWYTISICMNAYTRA